MPIPRLNVVLHWHMHQPAYRVSGRYALPWVYLHAIKDYTDMAAHVESVDGARAVFNFVPVLLDQLDDYRIAVRRHLDLGTPIPDPLLDALARAEFPVDVESRRALIEQCLNVNQHHVLNRWPAFATLAALARGAGPDAGRYLSNDFLADLLVWFHVAWLGEHPRRNDARVHALIEHARHFTAAHRRTLMCVIAELLDSVIDRYRRLLRGGRIEISVTPQTHPILPLLLDFRSLQEALPDAVLPAHRNYPGGSERTMRQLHDARSSFERHFAAPVCGCWPSEGAISDAALTSVAQAGFRWTASGGGVLSNSIAASGQSFDCVHQPFDINGLSCFFRDDGLSDLIGFSYKDWLAEDAIANLIGHLESIARHCNRPEAVVAIVLDGENAWDSYPANGFDFLQTLYRRLAAHPEIRLTTYSDYLRDHPDNSRASLQSVVAGSWVYGTLSTWMGHPDKNRAWDLLCDAKQRFDARRASLVNLQQCETLLAACEGSDWFWWFGDDNSARAVVQFDSVFRAHLAALYAAMGEPAPEALSVPVSRGSEGAVAHTMRASQGSPRSRPVGD